MSRRRFQSARDVSDLSHEFVGRRLAAMGERIPYETALLIQSEVTPEDMQYGEQLLPKIQAAVIGRLFAKNGSTGKSRYYGNKSNGSMSI